MQKQPIPTGLSNVIFPDATMSERATAVSAPSGLSCSSLQTIVENTLKRVLYELVDAEVRNLMTGPEEFAAGARDNLRHIERRAQELRAYMDSMAPPAGTPFVTSPSS